MPTRLELMEEEIKNKAEIIKLENKIQNLERNLVKSKTPLDIFEKEEWFKIDSIGSMAFTKLCKDVRALSQKICDLNYDLYTANKIIKTIDSKLSKKSRKEIIKELDDAELPNIFNSKKLKGGKNGED